MKETITISCEICGRLFEGYSFQKYCCEECRIKAQREKNRLNRQKHKEERNRREREQRKQKRQESLEEQKQRNEERNEFLRQQREQDRLRLEEAAVNGNHFAKMKLCVPGSAEWWQARHDYEESEELRMADLKAELRAEREANKHTIGKRDEDFNMRVEG